MDALLHVPPDAHVPLLRQRLDRLLRSQKGPKSSSEGLVVEVFAGVEGKVEPERLLKGIESLV